MIDIKKLKNNPRGPSNRGAPGICHVPHLPCGQCGPVRRWQGGGGGVRPGARRQRAGPRVGAHLSRVRVQPEGQRAPRQGRRPHALHPAAAQADAARPLAPPSGRRAHCVSRRPRVCDSWRFRQRPVGADYGEARRFQSESRSFLLNFVTDGST